MEDPRRRRCLIVAEAGTGHGGDLERGRDLVDAAVEAGADCVKFQLVFADEILHPNTGRVSLPGGSIDLYGEFVSLEQPPEFYAALKAHTESHNVLFLCSPFGLRSARILRDMGCRALKIASPELNHLPLLREVGAYDMRLIVSTGVATLADIEEALGLLHGREVTLLHCVTAYPAPERDFNLRVIPRLAGIFGVPVGLSDHSLEPEPVPALAVSLGATVVEKHLTLSRGAGGLDDPVALEPMAFARMVRSIRDAEASRDSVDRLKSDYGDRRVEAILGDGVKRLAGAEAQNYATTRRSIHARDDLREGDLLCEDRLAVLRTEKNLRPGLHPRYLPTVLGRRVTRHVEAGQGIRWDDLLTPG
jgi:N-acetylneuraminate synthase